MSQPLIVSVPHRLGRQEARRRLDSGIGRLQRELGALLSGLDHHWQGDTLYFTASAMWQRITGRIEVLDDAVRVEIPPFHGARRLRPFRLISLRSGLAVFL